MEREGKIVDAKCHALTASHVRDRHQYDPSVPICDFYEQLDRNGRDTILPSGVYSLDDLKTYSKDKKWCPYFLARHAVRCFFMYFLNFSVTKFHLTDFKFTLPNPR